MPEEVLLKRLYAHDTEAFEYAMDAYTKLLWVVVGGVLNGVGSKEDIEECVSDVFVKLWENPRAFDPKRGSLKTFLAAVAKNKALDKYRQLKRAKFAELDETMSSDNDLTEYIISKEMCQQLYDALNTLNEPDKEIMVRRHFFGEKPSFIANRFSIPVKEVENRLYKSKLRLKKFFTHKEGIGI